jgi:alpha-galactosidase
MQMKHGYIRYFHQGGFIQSRFDLDGTEYLPGVDVTCEVKKSEHGEKLRVSLLPSEDIALDELTVEVEHYFQGADRVFVNGFQSWTQSREFGFQERLKGLFKPLHWLNVSRLGDYDLHQTDQRPGRYHGYTYAYIRGESDEILLIGSLSEQTGYTIFEFDTGSHRITVNKDVKGLRPSAGPVLELALYSGEDSEVFDTWFRDLGVGPSRAPMRTGWTSWYNYYTNITEDVILKNLSALASDNIPIDIFQIDDGFATAVGDWLNLKPSFPRGMGFIAREISNQGYIPGLWLAPFICEKKSRIFGEHPDWLLRDSRGRLVSAGFNPSWSGKFYGLNVYHNGVRDYLRNVFDTVLGDWGFQMVKLDFLYAAALIPHSGKSRGRIMSEAMAFLRELVGDKLILGCGVPLGPSFGLVDYCRIGSDVALKWEDGLLKWAGYQERISTINSLLSTIGRRHLDGRGFRNDPDVFILRQENNKLTETEQYTLFVLNNLFGSLLFMSDDVSTYSPERMTLYRRMFPARPKQLVEVKEMQGLYRIFFEIDRRSYLMLANLSDEPRQTKLPEGFWFNSDLCGGNEQFISGPEAISLRPHETAVFLRIGADDPIVGSTGHIFPGSEVEAILLNGARIDLDIHPHAGSGEVFCRTPRTGDYAVNGMTVTAKEVLPGVFAAAVPYGD